VALLFVVSWLVLLFFAVRLMSKGWSAANDLRTGNFIESSKTVTKIPHPEMMEVKPGDELMVVNFNKPVGDDPLHESLKNRIEELEDDNDDDDGGALVPAVR